MNKYAMGGDLTHFNEGGTHEQNPLGGIPIGQNNSVEQGETKQNNFVYSDRIILDKNIIQQFNLPKSFINKTVAEATKIIDRKFADRNDKISTSTKNSMLSKIAEVQESLKQEQESVENPQEQTQDVSQMQNPEMQNPETPQQMYDGGPMTEGSPYMDSMTKGVQGISSLFNGNKEDAITNFSSAGFGAAGTAVGGPIGGMIGSQLGTVVGQTINSFGDRKRNQKINATNHMSDVSKNISDFAYGGKINKMESGGILDKLGPVPEAGADLLHRPTTLQEIQNYQIQNNIAKFGDKGFGNFGNKTNNQFKLDQEKWNSRVIYPDLNGLNERPIDRMAKEINPGVEDNKIIDRNLPPESNLDINKINSVDSTTNKKNKLGDMLSQSARYAPIAMNAYQLSQLRKPEYASLNRLNTRYKPEYVDEQSMQNIVNNNYNNSINSLTQMGGSEGATRNAILEAGLNKSKALSEAYANASAQNRTTNDRAQTFNLGVDQANLNQSNQELDINDRNQAAYRNERSKYLSEIGNGIGDVGKEQVYKKIAENTTGYSFDGTYVKSSNGNVVIDPDTNKPMTQEKLIEIKNNSKTTEKALGGMLIKNKK